MISTRNIFIGFFFLLVGCQQIETHGSLKKEQIDYIKSLGLLDNDEEIIKFYSEHTKKIAGNFFTNKRFASYWIDDIDSSKSMLNSAFYNDVIKLDTVYNPGLTYCPYLEITKTNGEKFKVCVEGENDEVKLFFEEAINTWMKNK